MQCKDIAPKLANNMETFNLQRQLNTPKLCSVDADVFVVALKVYLIFHYLSSYQFPS